MKRIITLVLILITANYCIATEEAEKINIKQAIEIASKNNLDIQSSRLNLSIEKNNIKAANRLQNPGVGVFYNFGKAGKGNPQQVGITQTVEIAKRKARKELAQAQYNLEKENTLYLETDLRMDVREAYTNLLAKKSVLKTMQDQEELLANMVNVAKSKYKNKSVDETDILQSQLLLNQAKTAVNSAKYEVKTALYDFNKVINAPNVFYDTVEESFTKDYQPLLIPLPNAKMPDFSEIANKAVSNRNDIKIALANIEVAKKNLTNVIRQRIPDFELQGGYSYQNRSQSGSETFQHGAYAGVYLVNIPFLYNYTPEIKNAKIALQKAALDYKSVENKALNDLKKAYARFLMTQLNLKYYSEDLLSDSEKLIKASRKSYLEDKIDLTTLITMEESYRAIIIAHTYALADYYNAWNFFVREVNNEQFSVENTEDL